MKLYFKESDRLEINYFRSLIQKRGLLKIKFIKLINYSRAVAIVISSKRAKMRNILTA